MSGHRRTNLAETSGSSPPKRQPTNSLTLRTGQAKVFRALAEKSHAILNCPTGWGKSIVIDAILAKVLDDDPKSRVIIAVPQRNVAKNFSRPLKIKVGSRTLNWQSPLNLCVDDRQSKKRVSSRIAALIKFVSDPVNSQARVVLTTHRALALAAKKMSSLPMHHLMLVIDEAHHIQAGTSESNKIGAFVRQMINQDDSTNRFLFATAYFFRGDRLPILTDQQFEKCARYHVPIDEYWKSLSHIKKYLYDFVAFDKDIWSTFGAVLKKEPVPTIIYVPPEGNSLLKLAPERSSKSKSRSPKARFLKRLLDVCKRTFGCPEWSPTTTERCIVDLVSHSYRSQKIKFIEDHSDQVAAILTCGMFKEGSDWVQAAQVIDLVPSASDQDRLQRFGRLLRDHPGKKVISYYSFFPVISRRKEEERRLELSKLYAHFHASLVLGHALVPFKVKKPKARKSQVRGKPNESINPFGNLPMQVQQDVIKDTYQALASDSIASSEELPTLTNAVKTVEGVLKSHGVTEDVQTAAEQVIGILRRNARLHFDTGDLLKAGFDKIKLTDLFKGLLHYSAGFAGPATLDEMRKVLRHVFDARWDDNYEAISRLAGPPMPTQELQTWVRHNKEMYDDGTLCKKRIEKLEQIGWWKWACDLETRWQQQFKRMKALGRRPTKSDSEWGWYCKQLQQRDDLSPKQLKQLESLSYWNTRMADEKWMKTFRAVSKLDGPPVHRSQYGTWLSTQRNRKEGKSGRILTEEQVQLLESIQWFNWKPEGHRDLVWEECFQRISRLQRPPKDRKDREWLRNNMCRIDKLSPHQIAKLDCVSWLPNFSARTDWQKAVRRLRAAARRKTKAA